MANAISKDRPFLFINNTIFEYLVYLRKQKKITDIDLFFYSKLCEMADANESKCYPSYSYLSKELGVSESTAQLSISRLISSGLISKIPYEYSYKINSSNLYQINNEEEISKLCFLYDDFIKYYKDKYREVGTYQKVGTYRSDTKHRTAESVTNNNPITTSLSKDNDYGVSTSSKTPSRKSSSTLLQDSCFEDDVIKQGNFSSYERDCKPPEEKEKTIYEELLDYWNQKEIIVHKKLSPLVIKYYDKLITKKMTFYEIKKAIDNYAEILEDKNCFFKYKWSLHEFLQRDGGAQTFLDKTIDDYKTRKNTR